MPISEAARADLYTGLAEVLGHDRAETLMAQLPRFDPDEVATKTDVAAVKTDVAAVKTEVAAVKTEVAAVKTEVAAVKTDVAVVKTDLAEWRAQLVGEMGEFRVGLAAVNQRLDRLFLTLLVAMFGVVAALIGLIFRIG